MKNDTTEEREKLETDNRNNEEIQNLIQQNRYQNEGANWRIRRE